MPGRIRSREFKLSVCRQIANGERRMALVCQEHHLAESPLLCSRKEYHSADAFGPHGRNGEGDGDCRPPHGECSRNPGPVGTAAAHAPAVAAARERKDSHAAAQVL